MQESSPESNKLSKTQFETPDGKSKTKKKENSTTPEAQKNPEMMQSLKLITENTAKEISCLNTSIKSMMAKIEHLVTKRDTIHTNISSSQSTISKLSASLAEIKRSDETGDLRGRKLKAICIGLNKLQAKYNMEKKSYDECQVELSAVHDRIDAAVLKSEFLKKRLYRIRNNGCFGEQLA